jgi:hypothetical protein
MATLFAATGNSRQRGGVVVQTALQIFSTCPSSAAGPDMRRVFQAASRETAGVAV